MGSEAFDSASNGIPHGIAPCRHPALLERLGEESDRIVEAMLGAIVAEVPLYGSLDPALLEDTRRIGVVGLKGLLGLWAEGRLARREELAPYLDMGVDRSQKGRPLPAVLRAWRVGAAAAFDYVAGRGEGTLTPADVRDFGLIVMGFVDQISAVVAEAYAESQEEITERPDHAVRRLFFDLLNARFSSGEAIAERAQALGVYLPERPTVLLAGSAASVQTIELAERGLKLRKALPESPRLRRLELVQQGRLVFVCEEVSAEALGQVLRKLDLRGVAVSAPAVHAVPDAYRLAESMLGLLLEQPGGGPYFISDGEARLLGSWAASISARDVGALEQVLGPLLEAENEAIVETLVAYFDTGNAVSAGHQLGLHPQTIRHRLRRARELTDRDPLSGWDRFVIELALRARTLFAGKAGSGG